jgi:hypothetical protein
MGHSRSRRAALISAALGTALGSLIAQLAPQPIRAEAILVGEQLTVRDSNVQRPAPGITMKAVEAQFGAPQERHPSVGEPPITRWDYAGFSVFFDHDRVIHSVVAPAEGPPTTTTASAATAGSATASAASAAPTTTAEAPAPSADAATASTTAPVTPSDAEAPIDATRPSAPATATASANSPRLAPDAPLPADTPVSAPPSSSAEAQP